MIADTSAWVEYLRATGSGVHRHLHRALVRCVTVWVPAVIYQEVLQGARSEIDYLRLQRLMNQFPEPALPEARVLAADAALIYARCRWQGITVRSPNDCLVAACAVATDLPLLTTDQDFHAIAQVERRLKVVAVSPV